MRVEAFKPRSGRCAGFARRTTAHGDGGVPGVGTQHEFTPRTSWQCSVPAAAAAAGGKLSVSGGRDAKTVEAGGSDIGGDGGGGGDDNACEKTGGVGE